MNKRQLTAKQVFVAWKTEVEKDIGKARYSATERLEQLDTLCEFFVESKIPFDDAMDFKRDFVDFVVTREGMKGNGQYKGWKEKAAENYEGLMVRWYAGEFKSVDTTRVNPNIKHTYKYGIGSYMHRMPAIVAWSKYRFGSKWTERICLEAHKIGSSLNLLYQKEVLGAKWAKSGPYPDWLTGY